MLVLEEGVCRQKVVIRSEGKAQTRRIQGSYRAIGGKAALVESWASILGVLELLLFVICTILLVSSEIGLDDELILIRKVILNLLLVHQVPPLHLWVVPLPRFHDKRSNRGLENWLLRHQTLRALFMQILEACLLEDPLLHLVRASRRRQYLLSSPLLDG